MTGLRTRPAAMCGADMARIYWRRIQSWFVLATAGAKWGKFAKSRIGCARVESAKRRGSQAEERALRTLELAAIREALMGHPCPRVIAHRDCTDALKPVLVKRLNDCGRSFTVAKNHALGGRTVTFEHKPPEHWPGTPEECEARIKAVSAQLRTMAESGEGPIYQNLGIRLTRVVLEVHHAEEVVIKSSWDRSYYAEMTNEPFCLDQYETVEDFLQAERRGNSIATRSFGHGITTEKYMEKFQENWLIAFNDTLREDYPDLVDSDGSIADEVLDSLSIEGASEDLFYKPFLERPLGDTISACRQMALQEIVMDECEKALQNEENERVKQALLQLAGGVTSRIQAFAGRTKFEKSNYKKLTWFLDELFKSIEKNVVGAALHFAGIYRSNSVGE
jgi:hypothetical protein